MTRTRRGLDHGVRPLPIIAAHVLAWVVVALVLAVALSDGPLTDPPPAEPLVVLALFGVLVGSLTGMLHVGVRVVRG